jgi:hypothetical protein
LQGLKYCVVKKPLGPLSFKRGGDIDIFVLEMDAALGRLRVASAESSAAAGLTQIGKKHVHYDLYEGGELLFRFDLYGALPSYRRVRVNPSLFESVVERAVSTEVDVEGTGQRVSFPVPARVDEMIVRYLEYCEYFPIESGKAKHLDWIVSQGTPPEKALFLERLHYYVSQPEEDAEAFGIARSSIVESEAAHMNALLEGSIRYLPGALLRFGAITTIAAIKRRVWRRKT